MIIKQYIKYIVVGGFGALINWVVLYVMFEIIGITLFISFFVGALLASVFNFGVNRWWTFEIGRGP